MEVRPFLLDTSAGLITVHKVVFFGEIGLHVNAVKGGHIPMNIDRGGLNLVDTEKVLLSIAAKDQGGAANAVPADQYVWSSSDEAIISLESTDVDGTPLNPYTRMARTPNPGSAVVTVTGPNGDTETLTLIVAVSGPGEIGLSAGTPIPE